MLCILNVGTLLTLCILDVGNVPTFSPPELVLAQWPPQFVKELNVEEALKSSILDVKKATAVPLSLSFLNGLLNHVVKDLNVEEVLKSPFFVVQKAAAPKNGVEFCQGSIGTIRSSLATS